MRFTVNKIYCLIVICICFISFACGQSEADKNKLFKQYSIQAYNLRQKGDLQTAISEQQKAVDIKPDDWEALTILAQLHLDLYDENKSKENLETAKKLLLKSIELNPNDIVGHDLLSGTYDRLGESQNALAETEKVVALNPDDKESLTNLAANYRDVKDIDKARQTFEEVLKKNPNYGYALYQYAEFELKENNRPKAVNLFEHCSSVSQSDDKNSVRYVEICRQRLEELKAEKAKTAKP